MALLQPSFPPQIVERGNIDSPTVMVIRGAILKRNSNKPEDKELIKKAIIKPVE
jgi:hypothetical protein